MTGGPARGVRDDEAHRMLGRYRLVALAGDAALAAPAVCAAGLARFDGSLPGWWPLAPPAVAIVWVGAVALHRGYENRFLGTDHDEVERILRAGLTLFAVIAVLSFLIGGNVSRAVVLFAVPATVAGSLTLRLLLRRELHRARTAGRGLHRTVVLGEPGPVRELVEVLLANPRQGLYPVAVCLSAGTASSGTVAGVPVRGRVDDVLEVVAATGAHTVAVVSHPDLAGHRLRRWSWELEEHGVDLVVSPGIVEVGGPRLSIRPLADLSLVHLEPPEQSGGKLLLKALLDRLAATALLLPLGLLLLLALATRPRGSGPLLTRQPRIGTGGRLFTMYSLRPGFTGAGWLHRHRLDELPQVLNVLRGEMSLVGPRPPMLHEPTEHGGEAARRLRVRPGMTGLDQVSGRLSGPDDTLQLDLRYVDNWSIGLDLVILRRAVRSAVRGSSPEQD